MGKHYNDPIEVKTINLHSPYNGEAVFLPFKHSIYKLTTLLTNQTTTTCIGLNDQYKISLATTASTLGNCAAIHNLPGILIGY